MIRANSAADVLPRRLLQSAQATRRLISIVRPPLLTGRMWSKVAKFFLLGFWRHQ